MTASREERGSTAEEVGICKGCRQNSGGKIDV